jgi:hypothetical protein
MLKFLAASLLSVGLLTGCERYSSLPQCSAVLDTGKPVAMVMDAQGSAVDTKAALRWYRCNAGQRFANDQCVGQAIELPRQEALDYAAEFASRAGQPWRLPTVAEMKTLNQRQCQNPAIDTRIFPGILVSNYWTSTNSRTSPRMGCTTYTFNGHSICKELLSQERPFLLVMDAAP